MKAHLLYCDQDFNMDGETPANERALTDDLGLDTLFVAMARGDSFLLDVGRRVVFSSLRDPGAIVYRQHALADSLAHPLVVKQMYDLAVEALDAERKVWGVMSSNYPEATLSRAIEVVQLFVGMLRRLRHIAEEHAADFQSEAFTALFENLCGQLTDEYFQVIEDDLGRLSFRGGVLISAELGPGNKGRNYVLRAPSRVRRSLLERISGDSRPSYTFRVAVRDEAGMNSLQEMNRRGINLAANALARSADHLLSFFVMLRRELGFYVGCINLRQVLAAKGEPWCFPVPSAEGKLALTARGLYDVCLTLRVDSRVVGNDLDADGKSLVMVTGANQGGKSTFLRSVGLAQLMMQCGMFVSAQSFAANVCLGISTHYRREEEATMNSGKLDEELSRMSGIADEVTPHSLVLFNESFAATNEREGSEIARQVIRALRESAIKVVFVTHMFDLARSLYLEGDDDALFVRAERQVNGARTFRMTEGQPLPTSYGQDIYKKIFGVGPPPATVPTAATALV